MPLIFFYCTGTASGMVVGTGTTSVRPSQTAGGGENHRPCFLTPPPPFLWHVLGYRRIHTRRYEVELLQPKTLTSAMDKASKQGERWACR